MVGMTNALRHHCCALKTPRDTAIVRTGVPCLASRSFNTSIPEPVSSTEKSEAGAVAVSGTRSYATASALPAPAATSTSALPAAWSSTVRSIWDALGIAWQGAPQQQAAPLAQVPTPPPAPVAPVQCPVELFERAQDLTELEMAVAQQPPGHMLPVQRVAELLTQHLNAAPIKQPPLGTCHMLFH